MCDHLTTHTTHHLCFDCTRSGLTQRARSLYSLYCLNAILPTITQTECDLGRFRHHAVLWWSLYHRLYPIKFNSAKWTDDGTHDAPLHLRLTLGNIIFTFFFSPPVVFLNRSCAFLFFEFTFVLFRRPSSIMWLCMWGNVAGQSVGISQGRKCLLQDSLFCFWVISGAWLQILLWAAIHKFDKAWRACAVSSRTTASRIVMCKMSNSVEFWHSIDVKEPEGSTYELNCLNTQKPFAFTFFLKKKSLFLKIRFFFFLQLCKVMLSGKIPLKCLRIAPLSLWVFFFLSSLHCMHQCTVRDL